MGAEQGDNDDGYRYSHRVPLMPVVIARPSDDVSQNCPSGEHLLMGLAGERERPSFSFFQHAICEAIRGIRLDLFYCGSLQFRDALDRIFATWEPLVLRSLKGPQFFDLLRQWERVVIRVIEEAKRNSPDLRTFREALACALGEALNAPLRNRRRAALLDWLSRF